MRQSDAEKDAELATVREEIARLEESNEILELASAFLPGRARLQTEVIVDLLRLADTCIPSSGCTGCSTSMNYAISPAAFYRFQARGFGPTPAELDEVYAAHRLWKLWRANQRVYRRGQLWKPAHRAGWDIGRD